jgi:hypothetical protein
MGTVTDLKEIRNLAMKAYMGVLQEHQLSWCPPPTDMKDRKWSQVLRESWPEYTSIDVQRGSNAPNYTEMRKWCDDKSCGYWVNGGGNRWYFERRDIAALFKLTFGGAQHD